MPIKINPLGEVLGAEVCGVDLSGQVSDDLKAALMEAIRARREKQEEKARKMEAGELEFEDPREAQLARQKKEEKKERRGRTGAKKGERKGSPELRSPKTKKKSSDGQMKFARKELG